MAELCDFILENYSEDGASLLLRKVQWPSLGDEFDGYNAKDILANTIDGRKKIKSKVPLWFENPSLLYPTRLCTEQCSSFATAKIKAELLSSILKECDEEKKTIADLTSGLGVDVWAFSSIAERVLYNDMDPVLVQAARHNFKALGFGNIDYSNVKVVPGNLSSILKGDWENPSVIFLDPARRDSAGKKVFLLEDCQPDVLSLMEELLSHSQNIVLKLSPMADISMVCSRLEKANAPVREIHVVSTGSECKELLIWIDSKKESRGDYSIIVHEGERTLKVDSGSESSSLPIFLESEDSILKDSQELLFEPGKAISKAGLFNYMSQHFSLAKAGRSSHLYFLSKENISDVEGLGKVFRIIEAMPFSGKSIKEISSRFPEAEVSSRNLPISSDDLRKKLKVKSSASIHIFAFKADFSKGKSQQIILVCERMVQ